jgi:hypothetical protein
MAAIDRDTPPRIDACHSSLAWRAGSLRCRAQAWNRLLKIQAETE